MLVVLRGIQTTDNIQSRGFHVLRKKNERQNFDGCPILSQAIGIEMLKTVFGIDVAHLEGPPAQAYAFYKIV